MHLRDLLNMEIRDFELERKRIEYLFHYHATGFERQKEG